jgi:hypothetical protein
VLGLGLWPGRRFGLGRLLAAVLGAAGILLSLT